MLVIQRPTVEALGEDHPTRQRFAVGPLEPGFGHTIGNSMRRALLSSIPGAAITTVKFDNAQHEFTTIPGMTEFIAEYVSDKAIGEDGYLAEKGLVALPVERAEQSRAVAKDLIVLKAEDVK